MEINEDIFFGKYKIDKRELFLSSKLVYGIVNFKPVVDGHVLLFPKRIIPHFSDLTENEISDLIFSLRKVIQALNNIYGPSLSFSFVIQDGKEAGQTVEHCHVHILPRSQFDKLKQEDLGTKIEKERVARNIVDMEIEAKQLIYVLENLKD